MNRKCIQCYCSLNIGDVNTNIAEYNKNGSVCTLVQTQISKKMWNFCRVQPAG